MRALTPKMEAALLMLGSARTIYATRGLRYEPITLVARFADTYSPVVDHDVPVTERIDARTTEALRVRGLIDFRFGMDGRCTTSAHLTAAGRDLLVTA